MWLPNVLSDVSIFSPLERAKTCWANILKQYLDPTKPAEQNPLKYVGYKIRAFGQTPKTKSKWKCGDGAIDDLLNLPFQIKKTKTFDQMHAFL